MNLFPGKEQYHNDMIYFLQNMRRVHFVKENIYITYLSLCMI